MSLPTWATVIGVIMLLFGGCGVLQNVQKINSPSALDELSAEFGDVEYEISKELGRAKEDRSEASSDIDSLSSGVEKEYEPLSEEDSAGIAMFEDVFGSIDNILTFSDYYKKWIVRLGIIGLIASIFYAIAGLIIIMGKKYGAKVCIAALIASTISVIFQIVIISMDKESGFAAKAGNVTNYFVILVNIILFIIIMASDKSYFDEGYVDSLEGALDELV